MLSRLYRYLEVAPTYKTSIERRLLAAEESQRELERELSQAKANIARLESDRRWLAEREQQEKEERHTLEEAWNQERVGMHTFIRPMMLIQTKHRMNSQMQAGSSETQIWSSRGEWVIFRTRTTR